MPFTYAESATFFAIEPELIRQEIDGRLGFDILPVLRANTAKVRWSQQDNWIGLQQMRGMDGQPVRINLPGSKLYEYEPGVYGEFYNVPESELTNRADNPAVNFTTDPIPIDDLVAVGDNVLLGREADRIESSIWTLLSSGTIIIYMKTDLGPQIGWTYTYAIQSGSALVSWASTATARPLADFQAIQLKGQPAGKSVDFGPGATAYLNSVTAANLVNNTNANDLGGRRTNGGGTFNTLPDIQGLMTGLNMPKLRVYDAGYLDGTTGAFTKYIPDGKVIVVGQRPGGRKIGNYIITRNANADYTARSYRVLIDRSRGINGERRIPPNVELHRGHNGGPAMYFASAVFVLNT